MIRVFLSKFDENHGNENETSDEENNVTQLLDRNPSNETVFIFNPLFSGHFDCR